MTRTKPWSSTGIASYRISSSAGTVARRVGRSSPREAAISPFCSGLSGMAAPMHCVLRDASLGRSLRSPLFSALILMRRTGKRVRRRWRDPPQGVGVTVVERRRTAADRQIGARHIGPAAVAIEGDVDAVIVGAKRLFEERSRANPEAGIAAPRLHRNAIVVRLRRSARQHHLPARNCDGLHDQPGGRFPQPITDLIVEGED